MIHLRQKQYYTAQMIRRNFWQTEYLTKRKEDFLLVSSIEVERKFVSKCNDYYEKMFGDTFYAVEMVMSPNERIN